MSIEKGDATKYVHTGNGELCYELNKALTVPETFPIYLSSAYIFDSIDPIDKICDEGAPGYAYFRLGNPNADAPLRSWPPVTGPKRVWYSPPAWRPLRPPFWER